MRLSAIFARPVNRTIEGVIKADDQATLRTEVEEFVITREVERRLSEFLEAYNNYQGANGAWISGFFGSGKSHLLKMMALLLENRQIDGYRTLDLFLPKCKDNEILAAEIRRAVGVPSRSILFNIDQKAVLISKAQVDAVLSVFVQVFDEMCGYYGKQGHIAQFERDLDSRGQYAPFKQAYAAIAGREWARGREQALLESQHIASAYSQVTGEPREAAVGILERYRSTYRMSIEDFAEQVAAYVTSQGPAFRLNFFVDEVGQYIADNPKLMLNLQTIAESLATKCRGRAWVVVTSQDGLDEIVGELSKQQGTDFSKIMARFRTRMKLTSTNVDEVIQDRLLKKNDAGIASLAALYTEQHNNFRTYFGFAEGTRAYNKYRDHEHFVKMYPFVPYQVELFQTAMIQLSEHNAFEGKHRSVGERSLLEVFQRAAMQLADREVGGLATFDMLFDGIRTALKANIQTQIGAAERQLAQQPLAIQLLKALFLLKYVREFKATPHNLLVLMTDRFGADLAARSAALQEALDLLEQGSYVLRSGDQYEYLTDQEKDVEQEIKNTDVETAALIEKVNDLVFNGVLKGEHKIRDESGRDYPFARKVDNATFGAEAEVAIRVISPFHEQAGNLTTLQMQAMGRDELWVVLPASPRFVQDLLTYKRTDKYVRQNLSSTQEPTVKRILTERQVQNNERHKALAGLAADLVLQATLIAAGDVLDVQSTDARTLLIRGFQELVSRVYINLGMLRGITYTQDSLSGCLQALPPQLGGASEGLSEAEREVLAFVQANDNNGQRTTLLALAARFEHKPYGWGVWAAPCMLAKLIARGKIEARQDSNVLEGDALVRSLAATQRYGNIVLEPQVQYTAGQVRRLKDFYDSFFDGPPAAAEARPLARETNAKLIAMEDELKGLLEKEATYPFLAALRQPIEAIGKVIGQKADFYLVELPRESDTLLDLKEGVIDPIRRFVAGSQRQIYDDARTYLDAQDANLAYVTGDEAARLRSVLDDPACYNGNRMAQAKTLLDALRANVNARVAEERSAAYAMLDTWWGRIEGMPEYGTLTASQQATLKAYFDTAHRQIERQTLVAVIRDTLRRFDETEHMEAVEKLTEWAAQAVASAEAQRRAAEPAVEPKATPKPQSERKPAVPYVVVPSVDVPSEDTTHVAAPSVAAPSVEYVAQSAVQVPFARPWLADEGDVDAYLGVLRQALLGVIKAGKRVRI
jgi:hypothetical protein